LVLVRVHPPLQCPRRGIHLCIVAGSYPIQAHGIRKFCQRGKTEIRVASDARVWCTCPGILINEYADHLLKELLRSIYRQMRDTQAMCNFSCSLDSLGRTCLLYTSDAADALTRV